MSNDTNEKQFKCLACGQVWSEQQTRDYPSTRTCGDAFCGTTCRPLEANEKPHGVTPGEALGKELIHCTFADFTPVYFDRLAQAAIDAYLASLPANGPSDEEIIKEVSEIGAMWNLSGIRALFAKYHAKELEELRQSGKMALDSALAQAEENIRLKSQVAELDARQAGCFGDLAKGEITALKARIAELEADRDRLTWQMKEVSEMDYTNGDASLVASGLLRSREILALKARIAELEAVEPR